MTEVGQNDSVVKKVLTVRWELTVPPAACRWLLAAATAMRSTLKAARSLPCCSITFVT